jgi:Mrp family chromosome partitioning ATPase/capsular polysaccharide biosynthesis protein
VHARTVGGSVGKRTASVPRPQEVVRRFGAAAVAAALIAGAGGYAYAAAQPRTYEATARMLLDDPDEASALLGRGMREDERVRFARNQAKIVTSDAVLERAARRLNPRVRDDVRGRIRVSADPDLNMLRVTASASTAGGAAGLADAVSQAYRDVVRERTVASTSTALAQLDRSRAALEERLASANNDLDPDATVANGVESSRKRFADQAASIAVIARNDNYVDGLAGTAAAGDVGPVLFTAPTPPLDPATRAELERVLPRGRNVYVLGGYEALAPGVEAALRDLGYVPQRLAGANRVSTAARIEDLAQERAEATGNTNPRAGELPDDPIIDALGRRIQGEVAQLGVVDEQARRITVNNALFHDGVEIFEPAAVPSQPVGPRPLDTAARAALGAFVAVLIIGIWRVARHRTAVSRRDPEKLLGVPLLGVVPAFKALKLRGSTLAATLPTSAAAEAYQLLYTSVSHALRDIEGATVLLTSPRPGDGKTMTAVNLAVAAARDDLAVLLVDADIRRRRLSKLCGVRGDAPGLVDIANGLGTVEEAVHGWQATPSDAVAVVSAGAATRDAGGFFRTTGFRRAMRRVASAADLVLIDSPPLLAVADPTAIASSADAIVLVVSYGTPFSVLADVRRRLEFTAAPVLGYVFTKGPDTTGLTKYAYGEGQQRSTQPRGASRRRVSASR